MFETVHYEGVLAETGEVFDSTHEDNTIFTFEVGQGTVIKAWDVALKTMKVDMHILPFYQYLINLWTFFTVHSWFFKVGEVAKITCLPDYAYGSAGSPPDIPPK